ncbi:MAG: NADH dehydrogenase [Bacteroidia bacterium]|jgi:NADH dehydrogenase
METSTHHKAFCLTENKLPILVVIGAGFAGVNFIKKLKNKPVQIVLLDQHNFHQFQPLLYQVAISGLEPDSIISPIRKLFKSSINMIYRMAKVEFIDTIKNRVQTDVGYVDYNYLVIATGSSTNFYGNKNIEQHSIGLKSFHDALNIRSWMLQNLEKAEDGCNYENKESLIRFVIVGGGPAGVEMAGAIAEFKKYLLKNDYPEIESSAMRIDLVQAADRILPDMSSKASTYALKVLEKLGVNVILNGMVTDYNGEELKLLQGDKETIINTSTVVWAAGVKGNALVGLPESTVVPGGRIKVNQYNGVDQLENVFAIGDVAAMITEDNPRGHPMVAQVAIQQGQNLAHNILSHIELNKFKSAFRYKDKGSMATIGKKDAVADLNITFLNGRIGWVLWSFIHLISITGFKNRIKVGFSWVMKYFTYEKANQLIVRKYKK